MVELDAKNQPKRTEQAQHNFKERRSIQPFYLKTNGDLSALFKAGTLLFTVVFFCVFSGTASVALAGLLAAQRAVGKPITEHRVLFLGAGEVRSYLSLISPGEFSCFWAYFYIYSHISKKENRPSCNGHIAPCWPHLVIIIIIIIIINRGPTLLKNSKKSKYAQQQPELFMGKMWICLVTVLKWDKFYYRYSVWINLMFKLIGLFSH